MKNIGQVAVLSLAVLSTACGGGGGGGGSSAGGTGFGSTISAQFIDAPVKGLRFDTEAGVEGQTGNAGAFSCKRGELVNFRIGAGEGLKLGQAACGEKIFVQDLSSIPGGGTWEEVASLIQSFAPAVGDVLDLSVTNVNSLTFTPPTTFDESYVSGKFAELENQITKPADVTLAFVPVSTARTTANSSLLENARLSESLAAKLDAAMGEVGFANVLLEGTLTSSSDQDFCWGKFRSLAVVEVVPVGESVAYQARIPGQSSTFFFDNDETDLVEGECTTQNNEIGTCEIPSSENIPAPKYITGNNFSMISTSTYDDSEIGGNVTARNSLAITLVETADGLELQGVLDQTFKAITGPNAGQTKSCRYDVVEFEVPGSGGGQGEEIPAELVGDWTTSSGSCYDAMVGTPHANELYAQGFTVISIGTNTISSVFNSTPIMNPIVPTEYELSPEGLRVLQYYPNGVFEGGFYTSGQGFDYDLLDENGAIIGNCSGGLEKINYVLQR